MSWSEAGSELLLDWTGFPSSSPPVTSPGMIIAAGQTQTDGIIACHPPSPSECCHPGGREEERMWEILDICLVLYLHTEVSHRPI